jgi:predicted AAA+ superfamily ATPase
VLPHYRRWAFDLLLRKLRGGLAPAVILKGARQVGKTTLQEQAIRHLLEVEKVDSHRILRVQFDEIPSLRALDEPILAIARWFENRVLRSTFNEAAHSGKPAYVFLDEVQNLKDWAPQLKTLVDHHTLRVVVTGSWALRIEAGRDSLAGRITTLELGTLLLREIAGLRFGTEMKPFIPENGMESLLHQDFWQALSAYGRQEMRIRDEAFLAFSDRGGYPMVQANPDSPWPEMADQLNESVVKRVIQHDLRLGERGSKRDPNLLEEVFRLACFPASKRPHTSPTRPATWPKALPERSS